MATVMLIPLISQSQVCCQVNLPQIGIVEAQVSLNPPSPPKVVYVEAQDSSDFHPSLKRYVLAWCRSTSEVQVKLAISYISYSTTVLFEEGCLLLATLSCPTSFCLQHRATYWNQTSWNNSAKKQPRKGTHKLLNPFKQGLPVEKSSIKPQLWSKHTLGPWLSFTSLITGGLLHHHSLLN